VTPGQGATVEFVDALPPRKRDPERSWARDVVAQLQRHPGKWAAVKVSTNRGGSYARQLKAYGCDATTRFEARGVVTYACWPEGGIA
jgi:hypothetical protein